MGETDVLYNVRVRLDSSRLYPLLGSLRNDQADPNNALKPYQTNLTTETVDCASLTFESIDDIEGSDGLSLGVFCVGDGIADDTLKEYFEDTSGFLVDEARDTLDTTTTRETTDCGFGNSLCKNKQLFIEELEDIRMLSRRILR
jgi:hypothetical protein